MCGIAGVISYHSDAPAVEPAALLRVSEHMVRRGPEDEGLWISDDRRVGFAHRRLAIIDLSDSGAQPMKVTVTGNCIVFNGEIYNYRELRAELQASGHHFCSTSDTEVLLKLYAVQGKDMLSRLRGMYAFAIWDSPQQGLSLARDPFGIKPLYLADDGKTLRFASQVKALLAGGGIDTSMEPAGHVGFFSGDMCQNLTLFTRVSGRCLPGSVFGLNAVEARNDRYFLESPIGDP